MLNYHRAMMFRAKYRQIGLFALPYQLVFEAVAPILETLGYLMLPVAFLAGLLSPSHLIGIVALATALNVLLTALSIALCIFRVRASRRGGLALFNYARPTDLLVLFAAAVLSNFGYRQYLVYWQLKGFKDFLKGRKDWDKFARKGFKQPGS